MVWNGSTFNPMHASAWSNQLLLEYQRLHPIKEARQPRRREKTKWVFPPRGRLKLNIDGSFQRDGDRGGIGVVVRDSSGKVHATWSRLLPNAGSAFQCEVEACRAALLLAIHQGWREIEVESDSSVLVNAMNFQGEDNSEVSRIIDDCKDYVHAFDAIVIRHIFREANSVADRLAHFASLGQVTDLYLGEAPDYLQDVLYEDFCKASTNARGTVSESADS
ncbi:uncharacterized protein LOC133711783 [Rosa rugosa]|uniref:uncharacterized protein LOC133711783 n=1 Tax=Rosa rugosa TaxID=74645 RepID=UPI002B408C6E|nr:uncharacterized protein LOC133711783 [Rosa rugosa]